MNARVLVVDDELDFLELMLYNLRRAGFEVIGATNGLDAILLTQRQRPDLVLLDIRMPGLDGISVCQVLNRNPETARIPIIIVSALDNEMTRNAGMSAGAMRHLTKPIDFSRLSDAITTAIRERQVFFGKVRE
jgi:DNA-binding response OmpR family regulator